MGALAVAARTVRTQSTEAPAWRAVTLAERGFTLLLLALISPLLLLAAVVIAVLSRDSPFVAHARVGRGGNKFWVIKLRTMWGAAPRSGCLLLERLHGSRVPECKAARDERVTSVFAAFCRRHSLDELPQLWQVVRGEMALIGPRPITAEELRRHYSDCASEVLSVAPGIAGLWQVRGRDSLTYRQRRALDLFLVRRMSLGLYLFILASTFAAVVSGRNAA